MRIYPGVGVSKHTVRIYTTSGWLLPKGKGLRMEENGIKRIFSESEDQSECRLVCYNHLKFFMLLIAHH